MSVRTAPRSPGRPLNTEIDRQLLVATQGLLIELGFERLTMDAVATRCGASKPTIYRRWPSKVALVVAAATALFEPPPLPDSGDLRDDLLACGQAYTQDEGRRAEVLASVLSAARHDPELRDAAREGIGEPYTGLFERVLSRAIERGLLRPDLDVETLAQVFPAIAYQQVAAQGRLIDDHDVHRVIDHVLLPALRHPEPHA